MQLTRYQLILAFCLVLAVSASLRVSALPTLYGQQDEIIPVKVVDHLLQSRSLDTNWALADLPPQFKYPQYNFSGYIESAAAVAWLAKFVPGLNTVSTLGILRLFSCALGIAVTAMTFVVTARLFGGLAALVAGLWVAVLPLLYQDTLYARPEPFVTFLTLLSVWLLLLSGQRANWQRWLACVILGVLVSTKVSMLALVPLALIDFGAASDHQRPDSTPSTWAVCVHALKSLPRFLPPVVVGVSLGFVAGVPHFLHDPETFWSGVRSLQEQYNEGQWPHGQADANIAGRLAYAAGYFQQSMGLGLFLAALWGGVVAWASGRQTAALLLLVAGAYLLRFGSYPTFFERNVSHVLPLVVSFASYGLVTMLRPLADRPWPLALAVGLGVLLGGYKGASTTYKIRFEELSGRQAARLAQMRQNLEAQHGGLRTRRLPWMHTLAELRKEVPPICPQLIEYPHFQDRESQAVIRALTHDMGFGVVGQFTSNFDGPVTSTLQAYFVPNTTFLYRGPAAPECIRLNGLDGGDVSARPR